jgi:putative redox protein
MIESTAITHEIDVGYLGGEAYDIHVRGHRVLVDQPVADGGADEAPTPTELFVGSLAACVAFYAGRYLTRHGLSREGLQVRADFHMAADRPARVAGIRITVRPPDGLPAQRLAGLIAVASHCTVHNSIVVTPEIVVTAD